MEQDCVAGETYTYTVIAFREKDGVKYWGNYNIAGVKAVPGMPQPQLTGLEPEGRGVKLSWESVTGAEEYAVFRRILPNQWVEIARTQDTGYTDPAVAPGWNCLYGVKASRKLNGNNVESALQTELCLAYVQSRTKEELLPDLPVKEAVTAEEYGSSVANRGICLNSVNNVGRPDISDTQIVLDEGAEVISLTGWAADFAHDAPLEALYLEIGDRYIPCAYGIQRLDAASVYRNDALTYVGFEAAFPAGWLRDGATDEISFIAVSSDGKNLFTPVTYQITADGEAG